MINRHWYKKQVSPTRQLHHNTTLEPLYKERLFKPGVVAVTNLMRREEDSKLSRMSMTAKRPKRRYDPTQSERVANHV